MQGIQRKFNLCVHGSQFWGEMTRDFGFLPPELGGWGAMQNLRVQPKTCIKPTSTNYHHPNLPMCYEWDGGYPRSDWRLQDDATNC
jgi:hypothetical protein